MKRLYIILIVLMSFGLPLVSALAFQQSQGGDIKHSVRVDGGILPGVLCNITILDPDNSIIVDFLSMTDNGDYFNYTLNSTQTSSSGEYNYDVTCAGGGQNDTSSFTFFVNPAGIEPTQQRTDAISRSIYFIFGIAILLFIGYLTTKFVPIKWSFLLLSLLLLLVGINTIFISLQDEVINPNLETFFSGFTAVSYYVYYFVFFLIAVLWIITFINTIIVKQSEREVRKFGG